MQLKSNIHSMPKKTDLLAQLGAKEHGNTLAQNVTSDEFAKLLGNEDLALSFDNKGQLGANVKPLETLNQKINSLADPALKSLEEVSAQANKALSNEANGQINPKTLSHLSSLSSEEVPHALDSNSAMKFLSNNESSSLSNKSQGSVETLKSVDIKSVLGNETQSTELDKAYKVQKNRNAEDASRQFMPGRKSIFEVANKVATKAEVTPQEVPNKLLDLENFMSRQSSSVQKRMAQKSYQNEVNTSLLNKKLATKIDSVARSTPKTNIMEMMLEQDVKAMDRHLQVQAPSNQPSDLGSQLATQTPKVFDLSSLRGSENRDAVIDQIQNYIVQAKAASEPKVEMSFKHHELGVIDLQVQKTTGDQISISIGSNSTEGMKFFTQNQGELLGSLTSAGIKVAEMKLDSTNAQSDFSQDSGQRHRQETAGDQRQQDSKRREELWSLFKERREAA